MSKAFFRKVVTVSAAFALLSVVASPPSALCSETAVAGSVYPVNIEFSPNIVNIDSERHGEIRIFTDLRYSLYAANGYAVFIYFNGSDSVENIRPTRDSLGNLIFKFHLVDLLELADWLKADSLNAVEVVISMQNGDEYTGKSDVYLASKRTP